MALTDVLLEISGRHHEAIASLRQTHPTGGALKGAIGDHHLAMARESCEAIAEDFITAHLNSNAGPPTDTELADIQRRLEDTVRQCENPVGYYLPASTNMQFPYVVPSIMAKIRKALVGLKAKDRIGFRA